MDIPTTFKADIGVIGLATMGKNFSRNIASKGFHVAVFNRTPEVTSEFLKGFKTDKLDGALELKKFVEMLSRPRKIILLVKAGAPVDEIINSLKPWLSRDDIIIDSGNSHYQDTVRRSKELQPAGIKYIGCGISGGEYGALHGPSLMAGGDPDAWKQVEKIFTAVAAKDFSANPCVSYFGPDGAGHYVKMVHNGIEYAIMQILAETYQLLRDVWSMKPEEIADVFADFNLGDLESYLIGISIELLRRKDDLEVQKNPQSAGYLIDKILDKAEQKGTGKWTVNDALDRGVNISAVSEAVFARITSANQQRRLDLSNIYSREKPELQIFFTDFSDILEKAIHIGILLAYAQGFDLLTTANKEQHWQINLGETIRIWQGGCIIRAKILQKMQAAFSEAGNSGKYLLELSEFREIFQMNITFLRQIVHFGIKYAVYMPALASSLQYFDGMTSNPVSANFIQGLRDYFGAHTYERNDRTGIFHTEWEKPQPGEIPQAPQISAIPGDIKK